MYRPLLLLHWFLILILFPCRNSAFQDKENAKITIAPDCTISDPEDPDSKDKMPKNTRAGSAVGKTSSRHPIQDWSNDDSDEDYMYLNLKPLAFAFPASPTSGISEDKVVNAEPLSQGTQGTHVSRKQGIRPRPTAAADKSKWQKVSMSCPKKPRPKAEG
jgi:hypothetical protein